jgi:RimJ/RimL family protein N-acetyltransferase
MSAGAPPLRPKTLEAILGFWAQELGMNVPELMARADGVTLSPSPNMPGILIFRRGNDVRIAAHLQRLQKIHDAILGHTFQMLLRPEFWQRHPALAGAIIGPATLFYLDAVPEKWTNGAPRGLTVRGLSAIDAKASAEFIEALTKEQREHSGLELGPRPLWGVFKGKELLAMAGYDSWPGRIAHLGVAVHPEHRGKKLGKLAVQAAARGALARRRIVQYRCLVENTASMGIAKSLGFVPFAETLYLRPPQSS